MRVALAATVCLFAIACGSSEELPEVTRASCLKARDHLADLRLRGYGTVIDPLGKPVDMTSYRAAMKRALGNKYIDTCVASMSRKQVHCTLDAKTLSEALDCK